MGGGEVNSAAAIILHSIRYKQSNSGEGRVASPFPHLSCSDYCICSPGGGGGGRSRFTN